jgi:hypothetical protein
MIQKNKVLGMFDSGILIVTKNQKNSQKELNEKY